MSDTSTSPSQAENLRAHQLRLHQTALSMRLRSYMSGDINRVIFASPILTDGRPLAIVDRLTETWNCRCTALDALLPRHRDWTIFNRIPTTTILSFECQKRYQN